MTASVRVACRVRVQEGATLLKEVVELALFVSRSALLVGEPAG